MDIEEMEPTIKVIAMPQDSNHDGDIFGGWIASQMDLAGSVLARRTAKRQIATVAMDNIQFMKPVFVGDLLECFCRVTKIGTTSITVEVDARVERRITGEVEQVTQGSFVYVAIDENRNPIAVKSGVEN